MNQPTGPLPTFESFAAQRTEEAKFKTRSPEETYRDRFVLHILSYEWGNRDPKTPDSRQVEHFFEMVEKGLVAIIDRRKIAEVKEVVLAAVENPDTLSENIEYMTGLIAHNDAERAKHAKSPKYKFPKH